jgi:hypothetical protein
MLRIEPRPDGLELAQPETQSPLQGEIQHPPPLQIGARFGDGLVGRNCFYST